MTHRHAVPAACLAAITAIALLAAVPASACDEHGRSTAPVTFVLPAPPPWVAAALPPPGPWVQPSPSVYYGWLDANRAAFLARWGWNPWRVARYDAWYGAYRAGLDARYAPPGPVAWARRGEKGHGHGNGWGRGHDD
jgi:hypothetical protein